MADEIKQIVSIQGDLTNIRRDLTSLETNFKGTFGKINSLAKTAFSGLGVGLGVGAVVGFGKQILDLAGNLQDLSEQTGISGQTLSGIKSVVEEAGSSLDVFANGVFKAQKELGEIKKASDPAAVAIRELGLNLDELRNADTDKFLELITNALAKIENPTKRAAVGSALLGRAYKELGPIIQALAGQLETLRKSGMSDADRATLDAAGDAWVRFSNNLKIAAAGPFADTIRSLESMARLVKLNLGLFQSAGAPGAMVGAGRQLGDALTGATKPPPPTAKFVPSPDVGKESAAVNKLQSALNGYRDSLAKTITAQEVERIKLTLGEQAALEAGQAYQMLGLKASLLADGLKVPPEVGAAAVAAEATLRNLGANTEILAEKNFGKLQSGALASALAIDRLKQSLDGGLSAVQAFADAANDGVGEQFLTAQDAARIADAKENLKQLREQLTIGAMDTSTPGGKERQRLAIIQADFEETEKRIRDLGRAAGASFEQIEKDIKLAREKMLADIGQMANEAGEQWANAFEGSAHSIVDALDDLSRGGDIKDVAFNLARSITDAFTDAFITKPLDDWIKKQADEIAKGGGGFGSIFETLMGGGGKQNSEGASDQGANAAISAIEAATTASNTGMQALSLQAQTALQVAATTAQTGLMTEQAVAITAIEAVQVVAIAAIQAAAASSGGGGGGMPGMSGGSMPGMDSEGGNPFSSFMEMFTGGGGEAAGSAAGSAAAEGGASFAEQGAGAIGSIVGYHSGGPIREAFSKFHDGGGLKHNERLILAEDGEFMFSKEAVRSIGMDRLDRANLMRKLPTLHEGGSIGRMRDMASMTRVDGGGGRGMPPVQVHIHGVSNPDDFRRSKSQWMADIARAAKKGSKHL